MAIALAGDAVTEERIGRGVETVRADVARERERIARAEQNARAALATLTSPVQEIEFVHAVCERAQVNEYLASYVVDKLRGQGSLHKDWVTGLLSRA